MRTKKWGEIDYVYQRLQRLYYLDPQNGVITRDDILDLFDMLLNSIELSIPPSPHYHGQPDGTDPVELENHIQRLEAFGESMRDKVFVLSIVHDLISEHWKQEEGEEEEPLEPGETQSPHDSPGIHLVT